MKEIPHRFAARLRSYVGRLAAVKFRFRGFGKRRLRRCCWWRESRKGGRCFRRPEGTGWRKAGRARPGILTLAGQLAMRGERIAALAGASLLPLTPAHVIVHRRASDDCHLDSIRYHTLWATMSMLDKFRKGAQKAGIQASAFLKDGSSKIANEGHNFAQGFTLPGEADKAARILASFLGEYRRVVPTTRT